jgi:hypothetical protein
MERLQGATPATPAAKVKPGMRNIVLRERDLATEERRRLETRHLRR